MKRKGWSGRPVCQKAGASNVIVKRTRRRESANPRPTLDVINPRQGPIQPFRSEDYPRNAAPFVDPSFPLSSSSSSISSSPFSSPRSHPWIATEGCGKRPVQWARGGAGGGGEGVRAIRRKHARLLYANWVTSQLKGGRGVGGEK